MIEISTIFVMMPTVQGVETLCRPRLPVLFRTTLIPRSILQLLMTVILGSNYVLRSNTGIKGHKNLGYDKTFSTLYYIDKKKKLHPGPEWFIFHNLTREFIDDVISVISIRNL